jgi:CheY-like chemotaxis protein
LVTHIFHITSLFQPLRRNDKKPGTAHCGAIREGGHALPWNPGGFAEVEALAIFQAGEPIDLLFSDSVMPRGMSGLRLAREAIELRFGLEVLLTTRPAGQRDARVRGVAEAIHRDRAHARGALTCFAARRP